MGCRLIVVVLVVVVFGGGVGVSRLICLVEMGLGGG